jgi:predicted MFS family arabinose efflux permease
VLVGLALAQSGDAAPVLLAAVLQVVGGIGYAATAGARAVRPATAVRDRGAGRLRLKGLTGPLAAGTALAVAFGITDTALAATAQEVLHDASRVGMLFTAIAGGSALGGVLYGTRHLTAAAERRALPVLLGTVTVGLLAVPLALLAHIPLPAILVLLLLTGLCIAPSLIVVMAEIDRAAPPGRTSEAQAWLATTMLLGASTGTSAGGVVIDLLGVPIGYVTGGLAVGAACLLAWYGRGLGRRGYELIDSV